MRLDLPFDLKEEYIPVQQTSAEAQRVKAAVTVAPEPHEMRQSALLSMFRRKADKMEQKVREAKAAAKRARRLEKGTEEPGEEAPIDVAGMGGEELSAAQLLDLVEKLHKQFDDEVISFEEFEDQKTELMARLTVE